jgi:5-methyltetrahydrofolate--homocysteine methyltransferase
MEDLYVDVSVGPIGADMEGLTRMAVDAITAIGSCEELKGIHQSVGLSNLSVMLPKLANDGCLLKLNIESAFLTLCVPKGLDTIIGTPGRKYEVLAEDNFILKGVKEALELDGIEAIMKIQELYNAAPAPA